MTVPITLNISIDERKLNDFEEIIKTGFLSFSIHELIDEILERKFDEKLKKEIEKDQEIANLTGVL